MPQVRDRSLYTSALEKGLRSERVLTLSLAEIDVQGVSTRTNALSHVVFPNRLFVVHQQALIGSVRS